MVISNYGDKLILNVFSTEFFSDRFELVSGVLAKYIPLACVSLTNKYCCRLCKCINDDYHFPVKFLRRQIFHDEHSRMANVEKILNKIPSLILEYHSCG